MAKEKTSLGKTNTDTVKRTAEELELIKKLEEEGTVTIIVGTAEQIEAGGYVDAGINGVFWRFKYGEEYTVPKAVARLLKDAKYTVSVEGMF